MKPLPATRFLSIGLAAFISVSILLGIDALAAREPLAPALASASIESARG